MSHSTIPALARVDDDPGAAGLAWHDHVGDDRVEALAIDVVRHGRMEEPTLADVDATEEQPVSRPLWRQHAVGRAHGEPLAEDFALYLAANSIDKEMWDEIKANRTAQMEETLDMFSDLVFEKALTSAKYLERVTETEIHCYAFHASQAHLISAMIEKCN